jgi:hypothetical protein
LLDGNYYNFTPFDGDISNQTLSKNLIIDKDLNDWIDGELDGKFLLHFKGLRKHLQLQIDWQQTQKKSYCLFIQNEYEKVRVLVEKDCNKVISELRFKHKQFIVNDILIFALLTKQKENRDSSKEFFENIIFYLKSHMDYRWKIITHRELPFEII